MPTLILINFLLLYYTELMTAVVQVEGGVVGLPVLVVVLVGVAVAEKWKTLWKRRRVQGKRSVLML